METDPLVPSSVGSPSGTGFLRAHQPCRAMPSSSAQDVQEVTDRRQVLDHGVFVLCPFEFCCWLPGALDGDTRYTESRRNAGTTTLFAACSAAAVRVRRNRRVSCCSQLSCCCCLANISYRGSRTLLRSHDCVICRTRKWCEATWLHVNSADKCASQKVNPTAAREAAQKDSSNDQFLKRASVKWDRVKKNTEHAKNLKKQSNPSHERCADAHVELCAKRHGPECDAKPICGSAARASLGKSPRLAVNDALSANAPSSAA